MARVENENQHHHEPKAPTKRRAALLFFGVVSGVLLATGLAIQSDFVARQLCAKIAPELSRQLYADVKIDHLEIHLISLQPRVELYDISVRPKTPGVKQEFAAPTIEIGRVRILFRPLQLMAGRVDVESVQLDSPHADLSLQDGKIHGLPLPLVNDQDYSGPASEEPAVRFRLDAVLVKNGTLHFAADEPDVEVGLTRIKALGTIEANDTVVLDMESDGRHLHIREGDADLEEPLRAVRAQLIVSAADKKVELRDAHAEVGDVVADGNGVVSLKKGPLDLDFSTAHVIAPLSLVKEFAKDTPPLKGVADYHGSFSVKGKNIRARGNAKVDDFWLDQFHFGASDADLEVAGKRAVSRRLLIRNAGGTIEGSAEMNWSTEDLVLSAGVDVADLSFARVLDAVGVDGSHVDARVDGRIDLSGPVDRDFDVKGTAKLTQRAFAWTDKGWEEAGPRHTNLAVPGGTLAGGFEVRKTGMHFTGIDATAGSSKLKLDGDLFFRGAADLTFSAAPVNLSEISPVGSVAIAGTGPATGRIHGDLDSLVIEMSEVDFDGMKVGGFDFGRGKGPLRFEDLVLSSSGTQFTRGKSTYAGPWKVDFHQPVSMAFVVDATDARVEDLADIVWGDLPASKWIQGGPLTGHMTLSGPLDALDGKYTASAQGVTVYGENFAKLTARGRWTKGTVWVDDMLATKASGASVWARGSLAPPPAGADPDLGSVVNAEARTAKMSLADLDAVGPDSDLTSKLSMNMHVGGRFSRPEFRGRLDLGDTAYHGSPLGASQIDFSTGSNPATHVNDLMTVTGTLAGGSIKARAGVTLWRTQSLPYTAHFDLTRHDIRPYLYALNDRLSDDEDIKASADAAVDVTGKVFDIGRSVISTKIDRVEVVRGQHRIGNHEPIVMSFGDGKIDVTDLSLAGDETDFHVSGREDADGNLNFTARGELDLAFYSLIDSANVFTRLEGVLNVPSLVINGTARDPIISGQANLERAAFKARAFPQTVDDVHGVIRFSQDEVVFEPSVTGKFGGGAFEGDGSLRLKGFAVRSWDLHARLADAKLTFTALTARVSGPLDFTGSSEGRNRPLMSGRLDANEVRFTQSFDWKAKAFNFARSHDVLVAPDEQSKLFDLDITVTAADNIVMKNELTPNGVELRTVPDQPLEILGNNILWYLGGSLELVRAGRVANRATFQDHVFDITSARVDFLRQKETFDFHYDVQAETVVRDWTIDATVQGTYLTAPSYEFGSRPPLAQEDINMLLVAGFTRQEAPDKEGAALAGILASVAGPGIADQSSLGRLKKVIPFDSFDVVPSYSQGGQVGLKVQGSKQLTPDLELHGDFLLGNNGRGKVLLDYRVNKTLHLEGGWNNEDRREGVDQNVQTQGDIGADAKFRFEWK